MTQVIAGGLEFLRHGKHCRVGQLRQVFGKMEIHSDDGNFDVISQDTFRREIVDGDIELVARGPAGIAVAVSNNWMQREGPLAKEERCRRAQIISHVDDELKRGIHLNAVVRNLSSFCAATNLGKPPCERTLRNWRNRAYGHQSILAPAWNRCGNRKQGPDEILLSCIAEVVETLIIKSSDRFSLSATWGIVEALYEKKWFEIKGDIPRPKHSIRKLKNFLRAMSWSEVIKLRLDGRTARAITRTAVFRNTADVMWEVVEMDATVLDVFVRDDEGSEIGRPVLYVAIDVATGYIVGLHLTIQKPSTLPFVECLRFMLFPKPSDFDSRYQIKNRIEVFGKPNLLRVDNGSEFIGIAATEFVNQLFADTARCQPYRPEQKPHVERFNGTLKSYILTLPGATTSSVTGSKRTIPKGEKLLTLEELRRKIYRFTYDSYSLKSNELRSKRSGKAVAPADIVRHMHANFTQPVPVGREEFDQSLCFKQGKRKLSFEGVSFDGWNYHSEELKAWFAQVGPGECDFFYSDLDVATIYIKPRTGELIAAFEKDWEGSTIDRATAKNIKAAIIADCKMLDRRTYQHKLAEFREIQKEPGGSRSRAKAARINDTLMAAVEQQKRSMPRPSPAPTKLLEHLRQVTLNDGQVTTYLPREGPRGRKMGEKK